VTTKTKDRLLQQLQRAVSATEDGQLHAASLTEILAQRLDLDELEAEVARLKIAAGEVEPPGMEMKEQETKRMYSLHTMVARVHRAKAQAADLQAAKYDEVIRSLRGEAP